MAYRGAFNIPVFCENKCRNPLNQLLANSPTCLSFTARKPHSSGASMSTLLHVYDIQNSTTVGHGQEIYIQEFLSFYRSSIGGNP